MLSRLNLAACLAACAACAGCCGGLDCGGADCGPKWWSVGPYAYMKYDGACETCGPGFCTNGGGEGCTCGDKIACGDQCTGAPGCGCGACGAGSVGAGGCPNACGGCCHCQPNGRCWVLGALCGCSGCGELYWNEWYNDPPRCYEPCDCYGNYVGPGQGGYYRAPYRRHEVPLAPGYAASEASNIPPLEAAEAAPPDGDAAGAEASLDEAPIDGADDAGPAIDGSGDAAVYEDAELSAPLQYPN